MDTLSSLTAAFWVFCCLSFTNAAGRGCQGDQHLNFTTATAVVSSDNFPENYSEYTWCRYYIHGPPNTRVRLNFTAFGLETSPGCAADNFKIFDLARPGMDNILSGGRKCGGQENALSVPIPSFGPFCGNNTPPAISLRGSGVAFEFCSDYGVQGVGWSINLVFESVAETSPKPPCKNTIDLLEPTQTATIESPNYPQNYEDGYGCEWTVNTNSAFPVRIWVRDFNLGTSQSPSNDTLQVADVTNGNSATFSPATPFRESLIIKSTQQLLITFKPDAWDSFKGFSFVVSYETCESKGLLPCDNYKSCVNASNFCDNVKHCEDGSDEKPEYCAPDCGVPHYELWEENRIVGGVMANEYSLPWQVAMMRIGGGQFCGGTIISDQWLATAAHCFTGGQASVPQYKARLGGHFLASQPSISDSSIEIEFEKIICHPYYGRFKQYDYDHCLIKLKSKIPFRKNIAPICLPRQGEDPKPGTICMTSGWGNTAQNRVNDLRQVYVPVADRQICNTTYSGAVTDQMICAGQPQGGRDSCQGDSGGPFVCKNNQGRWSLAGIVSWGRGCGRPGIPGIYARTGSITSWIVDTIATN